MQQLSIVKTLGRFELYCDMCDSAFDKDMFLDNVEYFLDIHRQIHHRMDLNTPDFDEK